MVQRNFGFTCVVAAMVLGCGSAGAQSLVEVARQEEARRATVQKSSRVYGNQDLHPVVSAPVAKAPAPASQPAQTAPAAREPGPAAASSATGDEPAPVKARDKFTEAYWRDRVKEFQDSLQRRRAEVEALTQRVAELDTALGSTADQQRLRAIEREKADVAKAAAGISLAVVEIEKEHQTFRARARAANVPLEWVP